MGVIKNLMVRIIGDARPYLDAVSNAGSTTKKVSAAVQTSTGGMKKAVNSAFSSSKMSIKEYTAAVSKSTQDYNVAIQDAGRLSDKIGRLQGVYDTVKNATAGLDLHKPLDELIVDAEKSLTQIESKRKKIEAELQSLSNSPRGGNAKRMESLQAELNTLAEKSRFAQARLADLNRIADAVGEANIGYASTAGLKELENQIAATKAQLNTVKITAEEAKQKLQGMGVGITAGEQVKQAAGNIRSSLQNVKDAINSVSANPNEQAASWLTRMGRSIRSIPAKMLDSMANGINRVANGIRSLPEVPSKIASGLKNIGSAALHAAGNGVSKLWGGVKKIGSSAASAVAGGVKKLGSGLKSLAGSAVRGIASIPQKLRNIGSSASASCGGLGKMAKSIRNIGIVSLGMRVTTGLFGTLRSVVSSYVSQNEELNDSITLLKNQLGEALAPAINMVIAAMQKIMPVVTSVASGINSVVTALFGNIAKTTSGIQSAASAAEDLSTYGFDQITKVSDSSSSSSGTSGGTGSEPSGLVQQLTNWIQQLKDAFKAGDWKKLGQTVGDGINSIFDSVNAIDVGAKIGNFANNLATTLHSLVSTIDFGGIGTKLGQGIATIVDTVDWEMIGTTFATLGNQIFTLLNSAVTQIDFLKIGQSLGKMISTAIGGLDWNLIGTTFGTVAAGIVDYAYGMLKSINFTGVGNNLGEMFATAIEQVDWNRAGDTIGMALTALPSVLIGFILGTDWAEVGQSVSECLRSAMSTATAWIRETDWLGIAESVNDLLTNIDWEDFGVKLSDAFDATLKSLRTVVENFDWKELGVSVGDFLNGIDWPTIFEETAGTISGLLIGAMDVLTGFAQELDWEKLGSDLWDSIVGIVEGIEWGEIVSSAFELLGSAIYAIISSEAGYTTAFWKTLGDAITSITDFFTEKIGNAGGNVAQGLLDGILEGLGNLGTWTIDNVIVPFVAGFSGLGNGVVEVVENMCNWVIGGINDLFGGLNKFLSLGKKVGLNLEIPQIPEVTLPRAATGTIVSRATDLTVGEDGAEAVVPLEKHTEWLDVLASKLEAKTSGSGGATSIVLQFMLGNRKITEYVIKDINQITRENGVCPIRV